MWGGSGRTPRNDSIVQRDRLNILNTGSSDKSLPGPNNQT